MSKTYLICTALNCFAAGVFCHAHDYKWAAFSGLFAIYTFVGAWREA